MYVLKSTASLHSTADRGFGGVRCTLEKLPKAYSGTHVVPDRLLSVTVGSCRRGVSGAEPLPTFPRI